MPSSKVIALCILALLGVGTVILVTNRGDESAGAETTRTDLPTVEVISPRNGSEQLNRSVVVRVKVDNFHLAPERFGAQPRIGEGHIRFGLRRVPSCVDPEKLAKAIESPRGGGRLSGASYDYPRYSGPNGVLAERIGTVGAYSPATRPEIFYTGLPRGFYRLLITLAGNDGSATPFHTVAYFEILPNPKSNKEPRDCSGRVSSTGAAGKNQP